MNNYMFSATQCLFYSENKKNLNLEGIVMETDLHAEGTEAMEKCTRGTKALHTGMAAPLEAVGELAGQGQHKEGMSYRQPTTDSNINIMHGFTDNQKKLLKGLITMMQVTNFNQENRENLKGVQQLIKALGPAIMRVPNMKELLVTGDSWSIHEELHRILMQNMNEGEWLW
ncbi:hypothetical protein BDR04DRAFT_1120902 [Suillus decipiens]|nr:hypothetical protein BDR04DRAFT_1120902 [Suillus decipiens]